jgi:hypothetical protein
VPPLDIALDMPAAPLPPVAGCVPVPPEPTGALAPPVPLAAGMLALPPAPFIAGAPPEPPAVGVLPPVPLAIVPPVPELASFAPFSVLQLDKQSAPANPISRPARSMLIFCNIALISSRTIDTTAYLSYASRGIR